MAREHDYYFKTMLIGDGGSGKTSLIARRVDDTFIPDSYGVGARTKTTEIESEGINKVVRNEILEVFLDIYNTTTSKRSISQQGLFLVYNVTDMESFVNVEEYFKKRSLPCYTMPDTNIVLVSNKTDLPDERVVSTEQGMELAKKLAELQTAEINKDGRIAKVPFIEVSAKTGHNVDKMFELMLENIVERLNPNHSKWKEDEAARQEAEALKPAKQKLKEAKEAEKLAKKEAKEDQKSAKKEAKEQAKSPERRADEEANKLAREEAKRAEKLRKDEAKEAKHAEKHAKKETKLLKKVEESKQRADAFKKTAGNYSDAMKNRGDFGPQ